MYKLAPLILLVLVIFTSVSIQAQDMVPPRSPREEKRVKTNNTNTWDLVLTIGLSGLKAYCDKTGKCPYMIVDKPTSTEPPVRTEQPSDTRIPFSAPSSKMYQSFASGGSIAIGPPSQYQYDSTKGAYDLLNGVWADPAQRSIKSLGEELREYTVRIRTANTYVTFGQAQFIYINGNSCVFNNYSGFNPRSNLSEAGTAYVCEKGEYKLFFFSVASGPDQEKYKRENQSVIEKMTIN